MIKFIENVNCMVEGMIPVPLKSRTRKLRGITIYRQGMVPDPNLYEIQPGLFIGHPVTLRVLQNQIDSEIPGDSSLDQFDPVLNFMKKHLR